MTEQYELDMKRDEPVRSKLVTLYQLYTEAKSKLRCKANDEKVNISTAIRFLDAAFDFARLTVVAGRTKEKTEMFFQLYEAEMRAAIAPYFAEALISKERKAKELAYKLFGEIMS